MSAIDTTHACPVRGCTRRVARHKLMCFDHWSLVPADVAARVYREYRREPLGWEHRAAMQDAIAAVDAQLGGQS